MNFFTGDVLPFVKHIIGMMRTFDNRDAVKGEASVKAAVMALLINDNYTLTSEFAVTSLYIDTYWQKTLSLRPIIEYKDMVVEYKYIAIKDLQWMTLDNNKIPISSDYLHQSEDEDIRDQCRIGTQTLREFEQDAIDQAKNYTVIMNERYGKNCQLHLCAVTLIALGFGKMLYTVNHADSTTLELWKTECKDKVKSLLTKQESAPVEVTDAEWTYAVSKLLYLKVASLKRIANKLRATATKGKEDLIANIMSVYPDKKDDLWKAVKQEYILESREGIQDVKQACLKRKREEEEKHKKEDEKKDNKKGNNVGRGGEAQEGGREEGQ
eukprot:TRINITY_DN26948_c0_g1_i1.p1 TRINITY_DN26948_c0_g1~~TRINITY_DN26948_c0_g1_i1.p1  ORF type:complete len:325 (-),score=51.91 TRINITY_DN26948_c0_g1_i1:40-1014(-)